VEVSPCYAPTEGPGRHVPTRVGASAPSAAYGRRFYVAAGPVAATIERRAARCAVRYGVLAHVRARAVFFWRGAPCTYVLHSVRSCYVAIIVNQKCDTTRAEHDGSSMNATPRHKSARFPCMLRYTIRVAQTRLVTES
jgi:hypothetical protein